MDEVNLGLWGTSDPNRVAVSSNREDPSRIVGYICITVNGGWVIEGDSTDRIFLTPRAVARAGINEWLNLNDIDRSLLPA